MPLDNADYISQFDLNNPVGSVDTVSQIDDFLREVKKVIQQSFPNINSPVNSTPTELNNLKAYLKYSNNAWNMQETPLLGVTASDNDSAVEPRSYNDARYLRVSNNLSDVPDSDVAVNNLITGLTSGSDGFNAMRNLVANFAYPVGSVYINRTSSSNPAALFGVGTWSEFAPGRTLVGTGSTTDSRGESRSFNAGSTGGEYQHILSVNEMPSHDHTLRMSKARDAGPSGNNYAYVGWGNIGEYASNRSDAVYSKGGNAPHNNMQPYVAVRMWLRTA